MNQVQLEMIEDRVDWITASCEPHKLTDKTDAQRFIKLGSDLVDNQRRQGWKAQPWRIQGCLGWAAGGASIAWNDTMAVLRLSGALAGEHWQTAHSLSTNVSRLDVCATFRHKGVWRDMSLIHLQEVRDYAAEFKPQMKARRIDGGKDGNSLLIGQRISEAYGRIYDKYLESKLEFYRDAWRYEVEFKKRRASALAAELARSKGDNLTPGAAGLHWLRSAGVRCNHPGTPTCGARSPSPLSTAEVRWSWLRRCVRPTVKELLVDGRCAQVVSALFGEAITLGLADELKATIDSLTEEE